MLSSRPFTVTSSKHVMATTRKLMRTTQLGQTVLARNPKGLACLFPNGSYFSVCKSTFRTNPTQRTHQQRWSHSQKNGNSQEPIKATEKVATTEGAESMTAWQRFLAPKEMPERNTLAWYREMLLLCTVFAITGSGTMVAVRPAVKDLLGLEGSFKDGPWSFRICSIVIMSPIYSVLLVCVGTLFGRHAYFRHFAVKMISRFGIPPEMLDATFHETKRTFRKW